jgi:hypothetical protein
MKATVLTIVAEASFDIKEKSCFSTITTKNAVVAPEARERRTAKL